METQNNGEPCRGLIPLLNRPFVLLSALLWLAFSLTSFAQEAPRSESDTLEVKADSLLAMPAIEPDSLLLDTLVIEEKEEGIDTTISYSADDIYYDVNRRVTVLTGHAAIEYKDMELTAGEIEVDWENRILTARPVADTLYLDSLETEVDTVVLHEYPHFSQGSDEFTGDEIAYNLETKIGRVKGGKTKYQDGEYYGEQFKRISDDVITVNEGEFTTCDADTPHYHFSAKKLKLVVGKRVIARPVFIHFEDVPVMAAPYGIFPSQSGRTSGIIIPTFGESAGQGRFLRDMGYYWAPSQYFDILTTWDYFEKFGVLGRSSLRYEKRYVMSGSTNFYFDTQRNEHTKNRNFRLETRHNQTIDPNTRLNVDARYVTNKQFVEDVGSVSDLLDQSISSNATFSKTWNNSPWSLSANVGYTQNIQTDTWSSSLPRIRLSHKAGDLFPAPKAPRNIRGAVAIKESRTPWYRALKWSYNVDYQNDLSYPKRPEEVGLLLEPLRIDGRESDATSVYGEDSSKVYQKDGLAHSGSFSANAKLFRYFNLNPSLNWDSDWVRSTVHYRQEGRELVRDDEDGLFTRTTFNLGTSINTKLYGMARRPLGIGASFRHTMTPTVGFRYRPDFSDEKWGYYDTVTMSDGRSYTYDRFEAAETASNISGTPKGLSESLSFGLGHLFQMKTGSEENENVKKFDLLNVNMSSGLDLKRDSLKWDDLRMTFRSGIPGKLIGPFESLAFDVGTTHSWYAHDESNKKINTFFVDSKGGSWLAPLELTNMNTNVSINLRSETLGSLFDFGLRRAEEVPDSVLLLEEEQSKQDQESLPDTYLTLPDSGRTRPQAPQAQKDKEPTQLYQMPLDVSLTFHQTKNFLTGTSASNTISSRVSMDLTPRWKSSMNFTFDLDDKVTTNASVSITRDLHCWEASFQWSPLGFRPGYFLRIGLRSPQLQDVKIERHRGGNIGGFF